MRSPTRTYVNVNSHRIKKNALLLRQGGKNLEPVFCVRRGKSGRTRYAENLAIVDANGNQVGWLVYEPAGGLACGARAFLELLYPPTTDKPPRPGKCGGKCN